MSRQTIAIVALGAILVLVGFWFLLLSPKRDELAELESQIEATIEQQMAAEQRIRTLEDIRARAPEIEAQLAASDAVVPRDTAMPSAIRQLKQAADESGVTLTAVSPDRPVQAVEGEPNLARMELVVTLRGGYFQVVDFLRRVEDPTITPRGIIWAGAAVTVGDAYPTLEVALTGAMFAVLPAPAPAQPDPTVSPSPGSSPSPSPSPTEGE